MIVIMTGITMGGNYDLKAVSPEFFGEGNADVVCRICIHFICLEGLVAMITRPATLIMLEPFVMDAPKTKELLKITTAIKAGDRKVLYVLPENSTNIYLSSRNLPQVNVTSVDEISTYTIMNARTLVLVDGVQDILAERNMR